jgi:Mg2+ and Co2+ transporter CorA
MKKNYEPDILEEKDQRFISNSDPNSSLEFIPWVYWDELAREEWWNRAKLVIEAIFAESVMGVVSLILFLDLILSYLLIIPFWLLNILNIIDIAIWIFFILEYLSKFSVAPDRLSFIIKPWHIIDLLIITIPMFALLIGSGYAISRYIKILRGVQALQVIIRGGLTAKKHLYPYEYSKQDSELVPIQIRKLLLDKYKKDEGISQSDTIFTPCTYADFKDYSQDPVWIDISNWTFEDLKNISDTTCLPIYILESKLRENAYPRADIHDQIRSFFLKIPVLNHDTSDSRKWRLSWPGLLILLNGYSIITISKGRVLPVEVLSSEISKIKREINGEEVIYQLIKNIFQTIDKLITDAEEQLIFLEAQQIDLRPPNFLNMVYRIRKELGNIVSWLLHTKEGLDLLTDGLHSEGEKRIRSLMDQCNTLSNNASLTQTAFTDLSGYYLDYNGYQMNRVMKLLAALAALTMIPALIGGLLGMNLIDQPWDVTLIQIITIIGLIMCFTAWVYYKIGWISR